MGRAGDFRHGVGRDDGESPKSQQSLLDDPFPAIELAGFDQAPGLIGRVLASGNEQVAVEIQQGQESGLEDLHAVDGRVDLAQLRERVTDTEGADRFPGAIPDGLVVSERENAE